MTLQHHTCTYKSTIQHLFACTYALDAAAAAAAAAAVVALILQRSNSICIARHVHAHLSHLLLIYFSRRLT
jgi:hypothetical protein